VFKKGTEENIVNIKILIIILCFKGMNYGQVMSAKLNNDGQSQLEKSPYELKMLMDACGRQVCFLTDI
jgi:hypothetical protein